VILLDTHVWIWLLNGDAKLTERHVRAISDNKGSGLGVSVISCWEVAQLVSHKRMTFAVPVLKWVEAALTYPNLSLLPLTPEIAVESTQLPEEFHRDPADRFLVATARAHNCPILTDDARIIAYAGVRKA